MDEEILDIVDENDHFVRKATRKEAREKKLFHRVSRVIVKNRKSEFILQKRKKSKKTFPDCWDIGIAETVQSGESYKKGAIRGLKEEFGIKSSKAMLISKIVHKSKQTNEFCTIYELEFSGKIIPQREEIAEIRFLKLNELKKSLKAEKFHPVGKMAFKKYLEIKGK